jgi:hypothetical protein
MINILIGLLFIIIGLIIIYLDVKFPQKVETYNGKTSGIIFIAVGIAFLIGHFNI